MQAINVQSTAQYHRESQCNNSTFSQIIEKDPASQVQWWGCPRREGSKEMDGQLKLSSVRDPFQAWALSTTSELLYSAVDHGKKWLDLSLTLAIPPILVL